MSEIRLFAGNFAPQGWMFCQGQTLSIAEYSALFALIGTSYGGDGQITFALPDLRGRTPVGTGTGQGLSSWDMGQVQGNESTTLTSLQMPQHVHSIQESIMISSQPATQSAPDQNVNTIASFIDGTGTGGAFNAYNNNAPDITLNSATAGSPTAVAGGSQPFSNIAPYLAVNYIIAVEGIFPSHN